MPGSDENEFIDVDANEDANFVEVGQGYGFSSRGRTSIARFRGPDNDDDGMSLGYSVKEEDEMDERSKKGTETDEWDGMDMDMEL